MSTTTETQTTELRSFDFVVIGAGSGGVSCAKRAASYGAKVAIIEGGRYGGTCVNVGCVPKKIMYNASHLNSMINDAHQFGFTIEKKTFDWLYLKNSRDKYISRLNTIYENGLNSSGVTRINGMGGFVDKNTIKIVNGDGSVVETIKAKHTLIAVGGKPRDLEVPGQQFAINSDGFFALEYLPESVAVIGAGYIAVELAGVLNGLGSKVNLFVRGDRALRNFDNTISTHLDNEMKKSGINVVSGAEIAEITKDESTGLFSIILKDKRVIGSFNVVISAIGRDPLTAPLSLPLAGVQTRDNSPAAHIVVDDFQNTSAEGVYALGDVCGKVELTPMAIAAGRRLADRLFGGMPSAKADYSLVPTVVFSHPVIGTVGLTESEAVAQFGQENLKIYNSSFVNLWYGSYYGGGVGEKPLTKYKLICQGPEEKIVGLHCIGEGSDEVLQGFAVAIKMGARKCDFDNCVALHPTAAEEFVTLPPWGLAPGNPAQVDK